ncbi:MAG: hypothetical protein ACU841_08090 [Gammaproteobacteria bacterium]
MSHDGITGDSGFGRAGPECWAMKFDVGVILWNAIGTLPICTGPKESFDNKGCQQTVRLSQKILQIPWNSCKMKWLIFNHFFQDHKK